MNQKVYLWLITGVAALGGFLFGFDTAVISGTIPFIRPFFDLDEIMLGWAVSSMLLGCMAGSFLGGKPADLYGRKIVLYIAAILFVVSAIGSGLANSLYPFILYRIIGGLAVGMASMISPIYIAEVAPAHIRGRLVSLNQLTIVLGILVAYFSNYLLVDIGANNWRWMFAVEAFPAAAFFVLLFLIPESPRWLIQKKRAPEALDILKKLHNRNQVELEFQEISKSLQDKPQPRFKDMLKPGVYRLLVIGVVIAVLQQYTGINIIMYYAPTILEKTGLPLDSSLLQTIMVGLTNLVFTLIAMKYVDRVGRKPLYLLGTSGMAVCLLFLFGAFRLENFDGYWVLLGIVGFIAFFAISVGPIAWVIIAEIYPNHIRSHAMSVSVLALWVACFVVALTFPIMLEQWAGYTFLFYAVACMLNFMFTWHYVPETGNRSLEVLENELAKPRLP